MGFTFMPSRPFAPSVPSAPLAPSMPDAPSTLSRAPGPIAILILVWGVGGVALLLVQALVRMTPIALEPFSRGGLGPFELVTYGVWVVVSLYSEGYRGFQRAFVPRVIGRAVYLTRSPRPLHAALAPAFSMALIHARPRRLVVSWSVVTLIAIAVVLVRQLPYPWRGIVDGGVVVGLGWGLVCLCVGFARALGGAPTEHELDLP